MKTASFSQQKPGFATDCPALDPNDQDGRRWLLLRNRVPAPTDGVEGFFYGVTTTGVVCRPGCPSRTPHRQNVRFFDRLEDALDGGFRACLRCCPAGPELAGQAADRISKTVQAIMEGTAAGETTSLAKLAQKADLSPFYLQRIFRAAVGVTPAQYARRLRASGLDRDLAVKKQGTATEAIFAAGFQSVSRAYSGANRSGVTPGSRKQKGRGEVIRYRIADCLLGKMLVAMTDRGICSIAFADTDEALLRELKERFAAAKLLEDGEALGMQVNIVLAGLAEPSTVMNLPLHIRATAFQERVWKALQTIPPGQTRTYTQVAASIGQPTAARAVARACASNPLAFAVPCHRVVGSDGQLTGYRWGIERKRKLLELEHGEDLKMTPSNTDDVK